eukprot:505442_1
MRLVKKLLHFKQWNQAKDNCHITKHLQDYIQKYITNDKFNKVLKGCAETITKIQQSHISLLSQMVVENDLNVSVFLKMGKKPFTEIIKTKANIGKATGVKLFKAIYQALKKITDTAFFTDLNINEIDRDYHHILKSHSNKISIQNMFEFFGIAVHYNDIQTDLEERCASLKRAKQRWTHHNTEEIKDNVQSKNISELKKCYIKNKLDTIHSYLVHSETQRFIQKYSNCYGTPSNNKYVTSANEYVHDNQYGFGIDFSHPHLSPKYCSVADELLNNSHCSLKNEQFQQLLVKAIKNHLIAKTAEYPLICKYFDIKYNIIRNQPIGIKHILAVVVYTDMSQFCTEFRKTYRKIKAEETVQQVAARHVELYYCARNLYESIEFFGEYMDENLKVYHGLKNKMMFREFRACFNQPISTT